MDSHQFFGYGINGADFAYSSYPDIASIPTRHIGSLKFDSRTSPNSPFATHFDPQTPTSLSDSQEQQSSTDNLSGISASSNSLLDYSSYLQESLLIPSGSTSFHRNQKGKHVLWQHQEPLGQKSRSWSQEGQISGLIEFQPSRVSSIGKPDGSVHSLKRYKTVQDFPLQGVPQGNIKQLLIACARALLAENKDHFDRLVEEARVSVSITGDPIQRLGAYMIEGLVAKKEASGANFYRGLKGKEPAGKDLLSYMHILYELCPYLKFGYMAANGAIADACRNEDRIHIIDFQIGQGTQWMTLLQALAARPSGAPRVRITGIDDPVSQYARGDGLAAVGKQLAAISEKFSIPVEFHAVPVFAPKVTRDMLDIRPGESLAVNFPFQLHHTPDESIDMNNPRDGLLRFVKSLSPKVVTLVEQESNTNTAPFFPRFLETLDYYSAIFESIDVTLARDKKERINVEQHCLARDIVNVIACEGQERVVRHELLGKWKSRFTMAGFREYPLSSYVNSVIKSLLKYYSEHYTLVEKDGAMLLGWKQRNLISALAWH
ncbi:PREDICTED: chitin-inducible gibberellin-responsive protein 1-like [Ipomoea nil]|uniref:chitin-inducible gibberellin-responsive protein 1-like n=1 Tax=Ipomoea nil TaxID=35883 RepID=UPI000901E8AA|nr:PREDICTED: chitin-inducible gibberellin-responsive protein 1-like [Ipomoea nil]XP_019183399.1 PREDICTED: chitin-inducible gibberellin-responsive protein 1-like [Ipomoea nil]XP_019183400.1 PREDICTED: chitin-inducible gibberellin-responsive protein 1-like [Ipomoea nil]